LFDIDLCAMAPTLSKPFAMSGDDRAPLANDLPMKSRRQHPPIKGH
jgi:hypothetical protein